MHRMISFDIDQNGQPILPSGRERLFRTYDMEGKNNNAMIQPYSPDIPGQCHV